MDPASVPLEPIGTPTQFKAPIGKNSPIKRFWSLYFSSRLMGRLTFYGAVYFRQISEAIQ